MGEEVLSNETASLPALGTREGSRELPVAHSKVCHSPSAKCRGMRGAHMVHRPPGAGRRLLEPDLQKGKERDKTTSPVHEDPQTALSFPKQ